MNEALLKDPSPLSPLSMISLKAYNVKTILSFVELYAVRKKLVFKSIIKSNFQLTLDFSAESPIIGLNAVNYSII